MLAVIAVAMVVAAMPVSQKMHPATKQENHNKKSVCNHPAHIELLPPHRLEQTESFVGCLALTSELCLPSQPLPGIRNRSLTVTLRVQDETFRICHQGMRRKVACAAKS
jgi:hypothetical protein